jgi:hypothetical protein
LDLTNSEDKARVMTKLNIKSLPVIKYMPYGDRARKESSRLVFDSKVTMAKFIEELDEFVSDSHLIELATENLAFQIQQSLAQDKALIVLLSHTQQDETAVIYRMMSHLEAF